jgi:ubiquinone/menaquinone biosynthesis C-methylase UbiE
VWDGDDLNELGSPMTNVDEQTVAGFGDEWTRFDQSETSSEELDRIFAQYFSVFPWETISKKAQGADFGCGSGRWAARVAPRVGHLHLVDASAEALVIAQRNLAAISNCSFDLATVDTAPIQDSSLDFGYSLGVLHHIPDTRAALAACVRKLKPGAPFLLYLYYRFDNRPPWYAALWKASEMARRRISRFPHGARYLVSQAIAASVYYPIARSAKLAERLGVDVEGLPLAYYRDRSFYVMRNDALDRFGTRLEQRFTRNEIREMMTTAGLRDVTFSDAAPYWCAVGYRV